MLRTVGRVVRTRLNNFQESLPSSNNSSSSSSPKKKSSSLSSTTTKTKKTTSKHALSISSSTPCNIINDNGIPLPVSAAWPPSPHYFITNNYVGNDDDDDNNVVSEVDSGWECFENYYDPVFGVVPSTHEVQHALLSLQQVLHSHSCPQCKEIPFDVDKDTEDQTMSAMVPVERASSKGSDLDWIEPSMHPYNMKLTQSPGWEKVHDAFHLLQTEPSVQRMVVSLSSDKAVWDAVLNNEAVQEIRDSYCNAAESFPQSSDGRPDPSKSNFSIFKWIFENMKMKLLEVVGSISQIVGGTLKPLDLDKEEQSCAFMEKLKSTFLLTVVVLLIVVVARGRNA